MRVYVVEDDGTERDAHRYSPNDLKPDKYGKIEGYRCHPAGKGANKNKHGVYYRSIEDLADHLRANRDWGVRVTMPDDPPSLRYEKIFIDGLPR